MDDQLDLMVEARVEWTSSAIRAWYPPQTLLQNLRTGMRQEADRLGNLGFGTEFRDGIGISGPQDPRAWANRHLDLPGGGWAVTGIRFRGRDTARPFVDVVATTAPQTPDGLASVATALLPTYRDFEPLCLRVNAPDGPALVEDLRRDPRFGTRCAVDLHVVAGLVEELRARPRAAAYSSVRLRRGDPKAAAERVTEIYADLRTREPALSTWANPEDLESLSECAGEGLLFEVLVDAGPAGVVAALRYDAQGMTGFSVQEICLDAAHRGRRLAPGVTQRLVDELPAGTGDVLWGTIHPANARSLRSALSIGRAVVAGYVWVAPAELPGMP